MAVLRHVPLRSHAERDALVLQWLYLPRWVVKRIWNYSDIRQLGRVDAEGWGFVALLRAAELWNPKEDGESFARYAVPCIRFFLLKISMEQGSLIRLPSHCWKGGQRPPRCRGGLRGLDIHDHRVQSRDGIASNPELAEALSRLDHFSRRVMHLLYDDGKTLEEVGAIVGKSKQRIAQIKYKSLDKLRKILGAPDCPGNRS